MATGRSVVVLVSQCVPEMSPGGHRCSGRRSGIIRHAGGMDAASAKRKGEEHEDGDDEREERSPGPPSAARCHRDPACGARKQSRADSWIVPSPTTEEIVPIHRKPPGRVRPCARDRPSAASEGQGRNDLIRRRNRALNVCRRMARARRRADPGRSDGPMAASAPNYGSLGTSIPKPHPSRCATERPWSSTLPSEYATTETTNRPRPNIPRSTQRTPSLTA